MQDLTRTIRRYERRGHCVRDNTGDRAARADSSTARHNRCPPHVYRDLVCKPRKAIYLTPFLSLKLAFAFASASASASPRVSSCVTCVSTSPRLAYLRLPLTSATLRVPLCDHTFIIRFPYPTQANPRHSRHSLPSLTPDRSPRPRPRERYSRDPRPAIRIPRAIAHIPSPRIPPIPPGPWDSQTHSHPRTSSRISHPPHVITLPRVRCGLGIVFHTAAGQRLSG